MRDLDAIREINRTPKAERYRVQRDRVATALERVLSAAPGIPGDVANFAANALHAARADLEPEEA
jgi:hypothetical protein